MGEQILKNALENMHYLNYFLFFMKSQNRISNLELNTARFGTESEDTETVSVFMEINIVEKTILLEMWYFRYSCKINKKEMHPKK